MPAQTDTSLMNANGWFYLCFIVVISFFTYFYNYQYPPHVFWDEPYHIASAQKYLNRISFMEQHPPLGKLLIALGEKIINANEQDNQFIDTDYARDFPSGFSFAGYRLFPVLLAWLTAPLIFLVFLLLTSNQSMASLLSFLYIFDNAMIVHNRGAMVDSPVVFFCTAMIVLFLALLRWRTGRPFLALSLAFGLSFGLLMTTKVVGLIMILLIPALLWKYNADAYQATVKSSRGILRFFPERRRSLQFLFITIIGFLVAWVSVWQVHFSLGTTLNPKLSNSGFYEASEEYKRIIGMHATSSPLSFPTMIRDSLRFVSHYNRGVPRLDLCKADENGSPFYFWPLGARAINYRWEQAGTDIYRYLYLQSNPIVWMAGFFGLVMSVVIVLSWWLLPLKERPKHLFLMLTFLALYGGYMAAMSMITRVMYLYHYFVPLLFSFVLFALVLQNIQRFGKRKVTEHGMVLFLTVLGVCIFVSYQFYRPLSNYLAIDNKSFERRELFPLWELHCVNCPKVSGLVVPTK